MRRRISKLAAFAKDKNVMKTFYAICILTVLTAVWWIVAVTVFHNNPIIPTPPEVVEKLAFSSSSGKLWLALWNTFFKSFLGFLTALSLGIVCAVLAHRYKRVKYCIDPIVTVIRAFPTLAITYLLLMYLKTEQAAVVVGALMVFPLMYAGQYTALGGVNKDILAMADVYGVKQMAKLRHIYLPGIAPALFTAAIGAFALNLKVVIAAEIVGGIAPDTVGNYMAAARESYDYAGMFSWVLAAIIFAFATEMILKFVMRLSIPWKYPTRRILLSLIGVKPKAHKQEPYDVEKEGIVPAKIVFTDVDFTHGTQEILSGFGATLQAGKIHCIMGPSGAGKTTLLNLAAGVLKPQHGTVDGTEKVSYLFQEPRLVAEKTVLQNLVFALTPLYAQSDLSKKEKKAEVLRRAIHYLAAVGLEHALDLLPHELSGGMAQRVALARAFAVPGELLIMDEPFKGLDLRLKQSVRTLFLELLEKENRTVLIVTHEYDEALLIADKIHVFGTDLPAKTLPGFEIALPRGERSMFDAELLRVKAKIMGYVR